MPGKQVVEQDHARATQRVPERDHLLHAERVEHRREVGCRGGERELVVGTRRVAGAVAADVDRDRPVLAT